MGNRPHTELRHDLNKHSLNDDYVNSIEKSSALSNDEFVINKAYNDAKRNYYTTTNVCGLLECQVNYMDLFLWFSKFQPVLGGPGNPYTDINLR